VKENILLNCTVLLVLLVKNYHFKYIPETKKIIIKNVQQPYFLKWFPSHVLMLIQEITFVWHIQTQDYAQANSAWESYNLIVVCLFLAGHMTSQA
jgi:hypothetical protein